MNRHCKSRTRGGATSVADELYWSLRCKEKALREEEEHQKPEQDNILNKNYTRRKQHSNIRLQDVQFKI